MVFEITPTKNNTVCVSKSVNFRANTCLGLLDTVAWFLPLMQ